MTESSIRSDRLPRMRRWVYAPLVAALAAGAACSGVGISAAAEIGSTAAGTTTGTVNTDTDGVTAEIGTFAWYVVNATGKTVNSGHFCKAEHKDTSETMTPDSALAFGGDTPWPALTPGARTADAFLTPPTLVDDIFAVPRTTGTVEIDGVRWAPAPDPFKDTGTRWWPTFRPDDPSKTWHHVWIFWDEATHTPFLTREGGGEDIPMERTNDDPCTVA